MSDSASERLIAELARAMPASLDDEALDSLAACGVCPTMATKRGRVFNVAVARAFETAAFAGSR